MDNVYQPLGSLVFGCHHIWSIMVKKNSSRFINNFNFYLVSIYLCLTLFRPGEDFRFLSITLGAFEVIL